MRSLVIFLSLENFYLTAEKSFNPRLEGKAAVVVKRKRILDISPEAKKEGIHSRISLSHLRSTPGILILPYNEEHYLPLYHRSWSTMENYATILEPTDFHEGFIELPHNVNPQNWLLKLKGELLGSTQLKSRVGGGPNKLIARLSARWEMLIPEEEVDHFLLSVPLRSLGWIIDFRVIERLVRLGVSTVGEIKTIPAGLLKKEFPKVSNLLIRIGRGEDPDPVIPTYPPEKEEEIVELEGESDYPVLIEYLSLCSKELSDRIRSRGKEALELELIFLEGKEKKRSKKRLIRPISSYEDILQIASKLLREIWQGGEIYQIRIVLSQLGARTMNQLDLLSNRRRVELFKESVERIRKRYGDSAIGFKKRRRRMAELIFERRGRYLL